MSSGKPEDRLPGACSSAGGSPKLRLTFVTEGAREAGQAVAQAGDVVAGPTAVHTLWARLAAAVPIETRGTD